MSKTTLNDFQEATEAIALLLAKYAHKDDGAMPEWQELGLRGNLSHLRGHVDQLVQMTRVMSMTPFRFEDFVSTACRSLMILQHAILTYPIESDSWKQDAKNTKIA